MLELSNYQVEAKDFLLSREGVAGLFDEPGVGKTAPAIVAGYEKLQETGKPVFITCPAYLVENWAWEIGRFTPPGTTVSRVDGTGPGARHAALQSDADFVVGGYHQWSARSGGLYTYPEVTERPWAVSIFDEGHRLRGRNSQTTKHVYEMRRVKSINRDTPIWSLTGTPILNNPGDLYPLLFLWDKKTYSGYWNFVGEWCRITKTPWSTVVGQLRPKLEDDFQELIGQFAMRRTLADIPELAELEQRDKDYYVVLPKSVQTTISRAREEYVIEHPDLEDSEFVNGGGALYSRLRQMATVPPTQANPKLEFVLELLQDKPGPAVVYTWYKDSAKGIAAGLEKSKRAVTLITGEVPSHRRGELVDEWTKTKDGILVATISSLKEGISLIHASDVVFLEHSELPADQAQCVARLKRRGQNALVNVHHVWARGTPDMGIKRAVRDRTSGLRAALTSWLHTGE